MTREFKVDEKDMTTLIVRVSKETEIHVRKDLTEEEQNEIAIDLTLQKLKMLGINTEGFDISILREVTEN